MLRVEILWAVWVCVVNELCLSSWKAGVFREAPGPVLRPACGKAPLLLLLT